MTSTRGRRRKEYHARKNKRFERLEARNLKKYLRLQSQMAEDFVEVDTLIRAADLWRKSRTVEHGNCLLDLSAEDFHNMLPIFAEMTRELLTIVASQSERNFTHFGRHHDKCLHLLNTKLPNLHSTYYDENYRALYNTFQRITNQFDEVKHRLDSMAQMLQHHMRRTNRAIVHTPYGEHFYDFEKEVQWKEFAAMCAKRIEHDEEPDLVCVPVFTNTAGEIHGKRKRGRPRKSV